MTSRARSAAHACGPRPLYAGLLLIPILIGLGAGTSSLADPLSATTTVEVDAREAPRGILKVHLRLPVTAGPLTLVYPKWLPGRHGPAGPITNVAGPTFRSGDRTLPWRRDDVDIYAFHLDVPTGATSLEADFEVLTTLRPDGLVNGLEAPRTATESLAVLEWHQVVLYPAGANTDDLRYQASVRLPTGWRYASALRAEQPVEDGARFPPVSLTSLVDSTLIAGRYMQSFDLGGAPPVRLHVAADGPAALNITPATLEHYRRLVAEATALFGATHYRHYDFLYVLTDQILPDGLEHHESSDNRSPYRTFLDDDVRRAEANLLAHEYAHSWNGKYRRPAGLATPNYQEPMRDELLWVYEGLTEYLGDVLAARSGLLTPNEFQSELARDAAGMQTHSARTWRNLEDTTIAAQLLFVQPRDWASRLRRQEDFYQESALLWLEVDALIRRLAGGRRSLDDFCRLFYGGVSGAPEVRPYDFAALIAALNEVQPYDWRQFWQERLTRHRPTAPTEGLAASGWHVELSGEPSVMHHAHEVDDRDLDLRFSLGFYVNDDGATVSDVVPGSPGDAAGLAAGDKLIAVNSRKWSKDVLHDAVAATATGAPGLTLLIEKDDLYKTLDLRYSGGERYPHLVRNSGVPDLLSAIARPRAAPAH
jgi:predicted metalloprotease with PDZ domain